LQDQKKKGWREFLNAATGHRTHAHLWYQLLAGVWPLG
jgi:hypothetical protein